MTPKVKFFLGRRYHLERHLKFALLCQTNSAQDVLAELSFSALRLCCPQPVPGHSNVQRQKPASLCGCCGSLGLTDLPETGARIEGNGPVTKGQHAQLHLREVAEWSHSETKSVTKNWRKGCGHELSVGSELHCGI